MRSSPVVLVGIIALVAGCAGGGLQRSDVEDLPAGDAVGTAASGDYGLELYTRSCSGTCLVHSGGFTASLCDVGQIDDTTLTVTQQDGALVMQSDGLVLDRLTGGLDADGTFDVGGWGTQQGGEVEVEVRSSGTLAGDAFTGTAESRGHGHVGGEHVDCTARYDLSGARQ